MIPLQQQQQRSSRKHPPAVARQEEEANAKKKMEQEETAVAVAVADEEEEDDVVGSEEKNIEEEEEEDDDDDVLSASLVTHSPPPASIDVMTGSTTSTATTTTTDQQQQQLKPQATDHNRNKKCPRRLAGQVCICSSCEASRLRLLHRLNKSTVDTTPAITTKDATVTTGAAVRTKRDRSSQDEEQKGNGDGDGKVKQLVRMQDLPAATTTKRLKTIMSSETATTVAAVAAASSAHDADDIDDDEHRGESSSKDNETQQKLDTMASACRTILECIGEDPNREGLIKTPQRWAKALLFLCSGYQIPSPFDVTANAVFTENHNEMVVVRNIDIHSLCEHHMVPFTGQVHIGYIPNGHIVGLSKLARIAEMFARRLQVQERLTRQIADAVVETVQPLGVAVVVECTHFCMVMRGVQKTSAVTTTSSVRGCFETNSKTRAEFFSILHGRNGSARFC